MDLEYRSLLRQLQRSPDDSYLQSALLTLARRAGFFREFLAELSDTELRELLTDELRRRNTDSKNWMLNLQKGDRVWLVKEKIEVQIEDHWRPICVFFIDNGLHLDHRYLSPGYPEPCGTLKLKGIGQWVVSITGNGGDGLPLIAKIS